jgi:cytidylate kinase
VTRQRPVVAIDGPAGAGKTTVTRRVAEALGYLLVDTGALYRCVALAAERAGISWDDDAGVAQLAGALARERGIRFGRDGSGAQCVLLEGEDVSKLIRTQAISDGASKVSAIPGVRDALLDMQRASGEQGGVVLEGRDIGTVVFPDAEAKFFLTASVDVRARRRYAELRERGAEAELETIRKEVEARDRRDTNRPVAPLKQAADAVLIDSSSLVIDDVVARIVGMVRQVERELGRQ